MCTGNYKKARRKNKAEEKQWQQRQQQKMRNWIDKEKGGGGGEASHRTHLFVRGCIKRIKTRVAAAAAAVAALLLAIKNLAPLHHHPTLHTNTVTHCPYSRAKCSG